MLYTLSGAPHDAFAQFPPPRATALFAPTFFGEGPVRIADVTQDPRYAQNPPYYGMPDGHLPVRSYLAVPVKGLAGDVIGGLFFGHSQGMSSPSSMSGLRSAWRRGRRWRWRTHVCTPLRRPPIA